MVAPPPVAGLAGLDACLADVSEAVQAAETAAPRPRNDRRALLGLLDGEGQVDIAADLGITQPAVAKRVRATVGRSR